MNVAPMKVELIDKMGSDLSVVNAARVSFHKESEWEHWVPETGEVKAPDWDTLERLSEKDQKLISYLAKHGHWSPFAHTSLQFRIKAPIFVARQLVKHQVGGVWNEVSRRYVDDEPEFWFPKEWRGKPVNAKQGSSGVVDLYSEDSMFDSFYDPQGITTFCVTAYDRLLSIGVAPEQARMILPQNTMTEWIWTGSLMFFTRVCKQRLDPHAQQETREVAQLINDLVPEEFQHSWSALMKGE